MKTGLDQYTDIITDAVKNSAAKLTKSFEKILIEVIILYMIIPRKVNFTQMERYGSHDEQTYRNNFGKKKKKKRSRSVLTGSNLMFHLPNVTLVRRAGVQ